MENNNSLSESTEQKDFLTDESYDLREHVYASQGRRFLNWLIDNLLMRFGLSYLSGMVIGALLGPTLGFIHLLAILRPQPDDKTVVQK